MGQANNTDNNNSKLQGKVSFFHVLMLLIGSNLMLLFAPDLGLLNSILVIPDLYTWPATVGGFALVVFGFRGFFKKA